MKTPQVIWDEVAKDAAANLVKDTRKDMARTMSAMHAKLAKATGYEAEALRESIAALEEIIAEEEAK